MPSSTDDDDPAALFDRMLGAMEAERAVLANRLHDGPQQTLTAVRLMVNVAQEAVRSDDRGQAEQVLAKLDELASEAAEELRKLTARLYPAAVSRQGLVPALTRLAEQISDEYGVESTFHRPADEWTDDEARDTAIFEVAREAAVNAARHGRSPVEIRLEAGPDGIVMRVDDRGGNLGEVEPGDWIGIRMMRDRAARLHGTLDISAEQELTSVVLRVPGRGVVP
jgi:two-component system nitrate/nitrite sensor histidine kinase NarQ